MKVIVYNEIALVGNVRLCLQLYQSKDWNMKVGG